jgi:hypothetical protein
MKKSHFILFFLVGFAAILPAQNPKSTPEIIYRRSSLHTMIVESENFPRKDIVMKAFFEAPFPDKYNEHNIGEKSFDPTFYSLTSQEKKRLKASSGKVKEFATNAKTDTSTLSSELPTRIMKYLNRNIIAKRMVAKWFNRKSDGSFDMNLISERGLYNATEMESNIVKGTSRGVSSLSDAGIELIGNTFLVVNRFNYVSNEVVARAVKETAKVAAKQIPNLMIRSAAYTAADMTYDRTKEGYSVWATSYLYKLVWNDSIEAVFYNNYWMDKNNVDSVKKAAFDNTDLFEMEYIGTEKATGLVLFTGYSSSEEQIIKTATIRTIDAVYAKLQKKYDIFMPKTALYTGYPITAKMGKKEGLEGGEKFDVFEQNIDPQTGLTKYINKGRITVDKNLIWDNRFNASEETTENPKSNNNIVLDRTTFKGGRNYYSGMLIKQVK